MISYQLIEFKIGDDSVFDELANLFNSADGLDNPDHIELDGDHFRQRYSSTARGRKKTLLLVRDQSSTLVGMGRLEFDEEDATKPTVLSMFIHPDCRHRGVGDSLLAALVQRVKKEGASTIECNIPSYRDYAVEFAQNRGFSPDWSLLKLAILDITYIARPKLQKGLTIRPIAISDELQDWADIQNRIFKGHRGYEPANEETLTQFIGRNGFVPGLTLFAELDRRIAAFCVCVLLGKDDARPSERRLYVHAIGVLPEHRRRGLGSVLLCEILHKAAMMNIRRSELIVEENNSSAIKMYENLGYLKRYKRTWFSYHI